MGYKKTENKICSAFEEIVPVNTFEKITAEIPAREERSRITMTKKKNNFKFLLPVAACFIVCFGIFGGVLWNNQAAASVITIDVNPSVEITANRNDKVLEVTAVNEDAEMIIGENDFSNAELSDVVDEVITSMVQNGYMENENNSVLVTVQNDNEQKADELGKTVASEIDSALEKNDKKAGVINQTVTVSTDIRKFANDNYISYGKAVFIMNIASKDSSVDPVKLTKMSIADILEIVAENNVDISDFCTVNADADLWDSVYNKILGIQDDIIKQNEDVSNEVLISKADAQNAALSHAKLGTSDVEALVVELYKENARSTYYVEFVYNGTQYAYEIDCETGDIITCGTDYSPEPQMEIEQPLIG